MWLKGAGICNRLSAGSLIGCSEYIGRAHFVEGAPSTKLADAVKRAPGKLEARQPALLPIARLRSQLDVSMRQIA